jgi:Ser/Thr protein kinase RdoA (MazF antagonist)
MLRLTALRRPTTLDGLGAWRWGPEGGDMDGPREIDLRDDRAAAPNCRTASGLAFQGRLVDHLRARGFPALATRLPGGYDPANPAHLAEAGRGLARYHALVQEFRPRFRAAGRPALPSLEGTGPYALAQFTAAAEPFLTGAERGRLTRASSFLWSQFIRVPEALAGVLPDLPQLVIHGAWEPDALVFRGDRLTGVTGFEHAAYDVRALDLALALVAFSAVVARGEPGAGLDLDRAGVLVGAYRALQPVPVPELSALPLVLRARGLAGVLTAAAGFDPGSTMAPAGEACRLVDLIDREAEQARWLEGRAEQLISALTGSLVP